MNLTRVQIPRPDLHLAGLTYAPEGKRRATAVVLSHGYTAAKESMDLLASYLAVRGYPCLTFDCRGHKLGATGGRLDDLDDAVQDVRAAATWSMRHFETERCVLGGHSMGGLLSIAAAAEIELVAGVFAIASGPDPASGFQSTAGQTMLAQRADYVDGLPPSELLKQLATLVPLTAHVAHIPSLFIAMRGDILVKAVKVRELAERAGPKGEFIEIDGGHLGAPDRARGPVANWLDRIVR